MPFGYLVTVGVIALPTALALRPLRRPAVLASLSFRLRLVINEVPFLAFAWLLASTLLAFGQGDISSPGAWVLVGLAALVAAGLAAIAARTTGSCRTRSSPRC